ncbi:glycosyltransferase [Parabacteroides sp. OttesenSCG-928-G07]|nr:glycosyltransferase [Parabacteroides sp. OttesenSCG-928-G21]MDL2277816.1 glycosyltransferase [Parabacteroides sp. OttesenSCG-928-G07]
MRILFFNTYENGGGAAVAANRLMKALQKRELQVKTIVAKKNSYDKSVLSASETKIGEIAMFIRFSWERLIIFLSNRLNYKLLFKVSIANTGINVNKYAVANEVDVFHLHWINQGFLSLSGIKCLLRSGKPIVWTIHDMWPLTGICHHAWECKRFTEKCGNCPYLSSGNQRDLSYKIWEKKKFIAQSNIHIVTVSNWLAEKVRKSSITNKLSVTIIPNTIDSSIFYPKEKKAVRNALSLPLNKRIMLMGAANLNDPIKGFDNLKKSLSFLVQNYEHKQEDLLLILFGDIKNKHSFFADLLIPYLYLGSLNDINKISDLYSAADVTVVPSYYESFGQTIIESMACGCPAVSFDNGGQADIIDHKTNGYLAHSDDIEDFAEGINWAFANSNDELLLSCINKIQNNYTESIVSEKYIELYKNLLTKNK